MKKPTTTDPRPIRQLGVHEIVSQGYERWMSKHTQTTHPQPTQQSKGLPVDECICSAKCENIRGDGEVEQEVCSGLRVGNNKGINVFGVGNESHGLAVDECICSAACVGNCRELIIKKELEMGLKYCPRLDIELPVYKHMEYKPRHSAKQNNIFKLDTDTDTHTLEEGRRGWTWWPRRTRWRSSWRTVCTRRAG